jgi:hypothetical protein
MREQADIAVPAFRTILVELRTFAEAALCVRP